MSGAPAFTVLEPHEPAASVVFDSPHSGRVHPDDFAIGCTREEIRRGEDAYVDELIADAPERGVTVLAATYPRCYIDVNRAEDDIDAELLAEPWPGPLVPSEKTRRGLGLIRRYVTPGVVVNARRLTVAEVARRIADIYRPYHDALRSLLEATRARHGFVWHVDWHSMKSVGNAMTPDGAGARRPDFVVSDLDGRSAEPRLTSLVVDSLHDLGYTVAVNDPYKGGTIVQRYGDPARGVHCVQVEINRALYLDEVRVEKTGGFERLRANLMLMTDRLSRCGGSLTPDAHR